MSLYRQPIPSLVGGVSQQPAAHRAPDQSEEATNAWLSVVDGSAKRQPLEHVARLSATPLAAARIHTINRDLAERYTVVLTNGDLQVFKMDGTPVTVAFPGGKAYLTSADPETDFSLVTVADYTFVVNRGIATALAPVGADVTAQPNYYYWLTTKNAQGVPYKKQYDPNPAIAGGNLKGDVQTQQALPATPAEGDVYRITGYSGHAVEYVRYSGGTWQECYKPGSQNALDATTMPWALVRAPDGTFVFAPFSWAPRRVGDEQTIPAASFVGKPIREVFFWTNRLCFLAGESTIMSRASDFGNFFRMEQTDLLDDDVIDVATSGTSVNLLNYAVPFRGTLLLFSEQAQFVLSYSGVLSPMNVAITQTTAYRTVPHVRPVSGGEEAYFASEPAAGETSNGFALLHDYYIMPYTQQLNTADDITAQVPKYIPAGVRCLANSDEYDITFVLTSGDPAGIYVYKSFWQQTKKVQSAWGRWDAGTGSQVLSAATLDDYAYFAINRSDGCYLERLALTPEVSPDSMSFNVLLDRRTKVTGAYLAPFGVTEFTLPYAPDQGSFQLVLGDAYGTAAGVLLNPSTYNWISPTTVRVPASFTLPVYCGCKYTFRHKFSRQFYRNRNGEAVATGRLLLRTWTVNFVRSAYIRTRVESAGSAPQVEAVVPALLSEFTARTLGDAALTLNTPKPVDGSYTFTVYGDAAQADVTIENDTHVPSILSSAEFEGFYTNRAGV